jgi:hypothetical protein
MTQLESKIMKKYDIVIVSHEKDFNNIKHIVEHCEKNLEFDSIHLILSDRHPYQHMELLQTLTNRPVYKHIETDVLKIDKSRLRHRPEWVYQMMLKIFQDVTSNDNFLVIESDCIILKNLEFFNEDKTIFYLGRDHYHQQYYTFNQKLLGIAREYDHSFISEFMMYDKKVVKELLNKTNCNTIEDFLELLYHYVDGDSYPSDYDLYGNFYYTNYPENFETKVLNFDMSGRSGNYWSDAEIKGLVNLHQDKDAISFHCWGHN